MMCPKAGPQVISWRAASLIVLHERTARSTRKHGRRLDIQALRHLFDPQFHNGQRVTEKVARAAVIWVFAELGVHERLETKIADGGNAAERDLETSHTATAFRLGVLTSIPTQWVEALSERLSVGLAQDAVAFVEGRERDLFERLARGRLDAALTIVRTDTRFDSEILRTEGYSLALPAKHPLAQQLVIEAESLADSMMIARRHCEVLV